MVITSANKNSLSMVLKFREINRNLKLRAYNSMIKPLLIDIRLQDLHGRPG